MESAAEISGVELRSIEDAAYVLLALANSMEGAKGDRPSKYAEGLRTKAERLKAVTQRRPAAPWEVSERWQGAAVSDHEWEIGRRLITFER